MKQTVSRRSAGVNAESIILAAAAVAVVAGFFLTVSFDCPRLGAALAGMAAIPFILACDTEKGGTL